MKYEPITLDPQCAACKTTPCACEGTIEVSESVVIEEEDE